MAPVYHDRSLEKASILSQLPQSIRGAGSSLNDGADLVIAHVLEDAFKLIASRLSFLNIWYR